MASPSDCNWTGIAEVKRQNLERGTIDCMGGRLDWSELDCLQYIARGRTEEGDKKCGLGGS